MSTEKENNEQIISALKGKGITCRSCWWAEGGRCYAEPCERVPHPQGWGSMSVKMADAVCEKHSSKRDVLGQFFGDKLVIASEQSAGTKNY